MRKARPCVHRQQRLSVTNTTGRSLQVDSRDSRVRTSSKEKQVMGSNLDWTGPQGPILAQGKWECAFLHMPHLRGQDKQILTKDTAAFCSERDSKASLCWCVMRGRRLGFWHKGYVHHANFWTARLCVQLALINHEIQIFPSLAPSSLVSCPSGLNALKRVHVTPSAPCQSHLFLLSTRQH